MSSMQVPVSQHAGLAGADRNKVAIVMVESIPEPEKSLRAANDWLDTPFGQALLAQEARVVEDAFDGMFGEQMLQLGIWGEANTFMRFARTQRTSCIADWPGRGPETAPGAIGHLHRLPVETDSIDVVLLPHTLDYSDDRSHAILREADRVLTPHGHLVVLGFKPGGLWGLRRLVPGAGLPPGAAHLIPERQLSDWMQLLDMKILGVNHFFFRWPLPGNKRPSSAVWENRGQRFWPELAACYMLSAQKRVVTMTPVKKPWRSRPKVVGSIIEPTSRVSRIRFDRNR
jgi:SAM-dependent methyltransferase